MRPQTLFLSGLLIVACVTAYSCKKEKSPGSLPAVTQEGKNTLGCLVDGRAFARNKGLVDFTWRQKLVFGSYNSTDRYLLSLSASQEFGGSRESILIYGDSVTVEVNKTYSLQATAQGVFSASYMDDKTVIYETTNAVTGQLTITKIDLVNHFVSGVFSFAAITPAGDQVKVTDGRFDLLMD